MQHFRGMHVSSSSSLVACNALEALGWRTKELKF